MNKEIVKMSPDVEILKAMVSGAYQLQKLRIQIGNRIVAYLKRKIGQSEGMSEDQLEKEAKKFLDQLRKDYDKITDGAVKFPSVKKFEPYGYIDHYSELSLVQQYINMDKAENEAFKRLNKEIENYPIWTEFLKDIRGVGPAMASVLITRIDISKATYRSSLEKISGIDVAWDGAGRSKRSEHLVMVDYNDRNGAKKKKPSITFKPFLKSKLLGVLAGSFIKAGDNKYATIYYEQKHRLENHQVHRDNWIAIDIEGCKKTLGYIPTRVLTDSHIQNISEKIRAHINGPKYDGKENLLEQDIKKELERRYKKYVTVSTLQNQDLLLGPYYSEEQLSYKVKDVGGVLRKPNEKEMFVEKNDGDGDEFVTIEIVEEFDDTPDSKGRKLYKRMNIGKSKKHRHLMAVRRMIKFFLHDLYEVWRAQEGLPVFVSYEEAKLGIKHSEGSNL